MVQIKIVMLEKRLDVLRKANSKTLLYYLIFKPGTCQLKAGTCLVTFAL